MLYCTQCGKERLQNQPCVCGNQAATTSPPPAGFQAYHPPQPQPTQHFGQSHHQYPQTQNQHDNTPTSYKVLGWFVNVAASLVSLFTFIVFIIIMIRVRNPDPWGNNDWWMRINITSIYLSTMMFFTIPQIFVLVKTKCSGLRVYTVVNLIIAIVLVTLIVLISLL